VSVRDEGTLTRTARAPSLGALAEGDGTRFRVFCTTADRVAVRLFSREPAETIPLEPLGNGLFEALVPAAGEGTLYTFVVGGQELPDPYARELPHGVHGKARVAAERPAQPRIGAARPLREHVFYELHVGAFTPEGSFRAAQDGLPHIVSLGATALELMPVFAFAGARGWGYDGVAAFAPHAPYGTPAELRAFVARAHELGLSVFLDAVYNHFGPSGNYLSLYSPLYFTSRFRNAWGAAPNFEHWAVRRLVLDSARHWVTQYGFDGLRLDATHAIADPSPVHVLRELADSLADLEPRPLLVAEDERNEPALVSELGQDAVWADDFHHQVRVTLTGEQDGYYAAYRPGVAGIAEAIRGGWLYRGEVYPPTGRARGRDASGLPHEAFVYCIQNHDQVGNRALGDRLTARVPLAAYCAASTLLLFLPMTPLLFMGQEWAASTPFQYFTDHEEQLGRAISRGRRAEFGRFREFSDPARRARIPDPQAVETFLASKLRWHERRAGPHARVLALYRELLALRRADRVLGDPQTRHLQAEARGDVLVVRRSGPAGARTLLANFGGTPAAWPAGDRRVLLRSDGLAGDGPPALSPLTAAILAD
jgi:maltooligosyltrehalose trehalohydrolase